MEVTTNNNIVTVERYTGDDWVFPFVSRDSQGEPLDMTGYTFEGVLTNPTSQKQYVIGMEDGAALADQTKPDTLGRFSIKVSREITKDVVPTVPLAQNLNTRTKDIAARLQIAQYDPEGNRQTLGFVNIIVKRL